MADDVKKSGLDHAAVQEEESGWLGNQFDRLKSALSSDDDEESQEENEEAKTVEFQEQCFLLANIALLAEKKRQRDKIAGKKPLPYYGEGAYENSGNASLLLDGNAFGFVNKLTQHPNQAAFFNMETKDIAHLQPMIRLFKVTQAGTGSAGVEQEITFDSYLTPRDVTDFFNNKGSRGHGVGIQDFTFSYEADNPFAIKKSIKAKLTLFANSFEELLRDREATDGSGVYKYIELALKTGGNKTVEIAERYNPNITGVAIDNLSKLNFRLKAVVGWADPIGNLDSFGNWTTDSDVKKNDLRDAIYDSFITLNLTPTVHEFNIDEYGRVQFVLNYLAYVEDFFDQPNFNIFNNPGAMARSIERKLKLKEYNKDCKAEEVAELKKQMQEDNILVQDKQNSLKNLIAKLLGVDSEESKIYFVSIPNDDIFKFNSLGPYYNLRTPDDEPAAWASNDQRIAALEAELTGDIESAFSDEEEDGVPKEAEELDKNTNVGFFYVSDLLDIILQGIEQNLGSKGLSAALEEVEISDASALSQEKSDIAKFHEQFKKFRLLLGPLEIVEPSNQTIVSQVNLGDIPVSIRYFQEWLTKKMLKKKEAAYTLSKFTNDLFNELVKNFLNNDTCFEGTTKQKARVQQTAITSYRTHKSYDDITAAIVGANKSGGVAVGSRLNLNNWTNQPILNVSGERGLPVSNPGADRENNFLTYFAGRVQPSEAMQGNRKADESRGVFHYSIGRDRGIVKTINLSKTDSPGLTEYRFEKEGYQGLEQLRYVYDVNIDTYANVNAWPGSYIYVEPRGFSPSSTLDLTKFGIGGYHMIIRSEHSFGPGKAESKITAKWVADTGGAITRDPSSTTAEAEVDEEPKESPAKCTATKEEPGLIEKLLS